MAYLGDIIRTLKNGMASMNEANILRVMRQKDGSIGAGDERVLVGQEMLGGKEISVSGKMKILLLKIADGTVDPGYVRKNMELLREVNNDKQNLSKAVTDNIMAMTSCEDVVSALFGKKVHGLATEIPSASDEERRTEDGLEHFYERVRDACRKVFKKDGYRILLDKLDACHYIEKVYDRNHVVIAKVTSHEGAVGVGAFGASWCTCVAGANSNNRYDRYKDYDMRIVFVDRGDDYNSIWQLSEKETSWCGNADNDSDESNMLAAIIEVSGGDNTVRDIIDAIDNDVLNGWLDEEFGMSEEGIKTGFKYDKRTVGGYCIVSRERVVNGCSLLTRKYNLCKARFKGLSGAEFLFPKWVDHIYDPKDGFIRVEKEGERNRFGLKEREQNLFDLKKKEFVFPEWVYYIKDMEDMEDMKDGLVRVVNKHKKDNLFDLNKKEFMLPEWVDDVGRPKDGFFEVKKNEKWNLFDLKTKKFMLPEWFDFIAYLKDGFAKVKRGWEYNLLDLKANAFVLPEWVGQVDYPRDGFVRVEKEGKENLVDLKTNKFVLPEWVDQVYPPKDGFVDIYKDREHQKIKLSDLRKTESRRRCENRICECCGRRIR